MVCGVYLGRRGGVVYALLQCCPSPHGGDAPPHPLIKSAILLPLCIDEFLHASNARNVRR